MSKVAAVTAIFHLTRWSTGPAFGRPVTSNVRYKEVGVRFLVSTSKAFVSGFIAVLTVMFVFRLFVPHGFQPWVAVGIATGGALATGIRSQWSLSPNTNAILVVVLVSVGVAIGTWFSGHL